MKNNQPNFVFELTPRCNMACLYCYNVWKEKIGPLHAELPLNLIKKLFQKILMDVLPRGVVLAGGEPLLHPNLLEVATFFKEKKIPLGIATNGILLEPALIKELCERGVRYFEVSLPSLNKNVYESLCPGGDLEKAKQCILDIKKNMARLTVSFVITKMNVHDLGKVIDLCFAFSVDELSLNRFVPGGEGLRNRSKLDLSHKDLEMALAVANEKRKKIKIPINVTVPIVPCRIDHKKFPLLNFGACVCGKDKWAIDPLGRLRTCEQNPEILGSLFESSFWDLVKSKPVKNFLNNTLKNGCHACSQFFACGGGCRIIKEVKADI